MSKRHSGSALLILNFKTGDITAHWNTVFHNWFSTVATNVKDVPNFHVGKWSKMFGTSTFNSQPDNEIEEADHQLTQPIRLDIKDNTINKEEELQQQMKKKH